jgi:hypothetical protein
MLSSQMASQLRSAVTSGCALGRHEGEHGDPDGAHAR